MFDCSESTTAKKKDGSELEVSYMALEYAPHGEIFDVILRGGAFGEEVARYYFHQIIDALEYIHEKGFAHCDLKPENILLGNNFDIKLADFGFATSEKTSESRVGTYGYMAPEVLAMKEYSTANADVFAASVILFVMVTQHSPFDKAELSDKYYSLMHFNKWEKFWKIFSDDYDISEEFKDLFQKMMSFDPSDRLTLKEIKQHPWFLEVVPSEIDIKKLMKKKMKKLKKQKQKFSNQNKLSTKYYSVENGEVLIDLIVEIAENLGFKYKKSKNYFRISLKIVDSLKSDSFHNIETGEHIRTLTDGQKLTFSKVQVNVIRNHVNEGRCLEFVKLSGEDETIHRAFKIIVDYLEEHL